MRINHIFTKVIIVLGGTLVIFGCVLVFLPMRFNAFSLLSSLNPARIHSLFSQVLTPHGNLDLGGGKLYAANVLYGIHTTDGLSVSAGNDRQVPTLSNNGVLSLNGKTGKLTLSLGSGNGIGVSGLQITNLDPGSAQKMFGTIQINGTNLSAATNTDSIAFNAGSGINLGTDLTNKTITITNANPSQWNSNNSDIYYASGNVGVGVLPAYPLDVYGGTGIMAETSA